jgi:hypothetical protein
MAGTAKPYYWAARKAWYVNVRVNGKITKRKLAETKKAAYDLWIDPQLVIFSQRFVCCRWFLRWSVVLVFLRRNLTVGCLPRFDSVRVFRLSLALALRACCPISC